MIATLPFSPGQGKYFKCFCRLFHVEHTNSLFSFEKLMKAAYLCLLTPCFLLFSSCDKPVPNPETLDPIYADLVKQYEQAQKETDSEKVELAKTIDEISKYESRDPAKRKAIQQKYQREKHVRGLEERTTYFKIRSEQRLEFDQKDYLKAYYAKKPWPDPEQFKSYSEVKKLQSDSRNWDDRVPKTTRYDKPKKGTGKVEPVRPAEGKKEGE
jgi:hypothetical protein